MNSINNKNNIDYKFTEKKNKETKNQVNYLILLVLQSLIPMSFNWKKCFLS